MSLPHKVTLATVLADLPFALGTCYQAHKHGRWPWLTRTSPEGRRTRELWVDVPALLNWAAARGLRLNLEGGRCCR
jgi:hypothetical protein